MKDFKGYLMIIGAASLWGASATLAKFLINQHLPTLLLVQTRTSFSCIVMGAYALAFNRQLLHIHLSDLWRFALLGIVGLAGANFAYYFTIKESTVGTAITIQYTAPLFVMAYEIVMREERFTSVKLIAAIVSLTGCFITVTGCDVSTMGISSAGLISGIGSIFCFSVMTVMTRHLVARYSAWTVTFYSVALASFFWLVVNPPWNMPAGYVGPGMWYALFILAMTSVLLPNLLFSGGLRFLVPSRAIITSTLEPVVAIVTASLVIGELFTHAQMLGALLVISAIVILQLRREPPVASQSPMEGGINGPQ